MEVTRKNFNETLPLVKDSIERADFLVIDAEFTGLINGRDVSVFDSPEDYYMTCMKGCSDFLLIQFGLCAFYWDKDLGHYMNDAYNFYLFPRGRPGPERMFLSQSSSLDFLASQGFDFNKLIKDGISYMSEPAETRQREVLTERQKMYSNDSFITVPAENKQHIDDICQKVRQFLDEKKSDEMEIERCNAFVRRLLFQELGNKFKNEVFLETKVLENKDRVLKVVRITSELERKSRDSLKNEKEWEELEDAVGFSKVARMISQSEKLVIGHNMLLDLLHTLNHFFQPLPNDYSSFKQYAHCMFPKVLDTKYMSSLPPFKEKVNSNVLSHLLATLSEPPFSLPKTDSKEGRGYSQADDKQHEAGYDAFVTGLCFLAMYEHLSRMRGEAAAAPALAHSAALKPFLNKVFLAKTAHQDSPYINLGGADPMPSRDHVFHMTFPKDWNRNDINQLFSPYGPVLVQFMDETSALVALARRELARDVLRILRGHVKVTLTPYHRYKNRLDVLKSDMRKNRLVEEDAQGRAKRKRSQAEATPKTRLANSKTTTKQKLPEKVDRSEFKQSKKLDQPEKVDPPEKEVSDKVPVDGPEKVERPEKQERPEKLERQRSNSLSDAIQPSQPSNRKRTSSGVFQVDEAEPPTKRPELVRSDSETSRKKTGAVSNGRRKTSESDGDRKHLDAEKLRPSSESDGDRRKLPNEKHRRKVSESETARGKDKEKRKTEKFDKEVKSKCVTAFKESDSWD